MAAFLLLAVLSVTLCPADEPDVAELEPPPDADALLADVVSRLPSAPLLIRGELCVRLPRGVPVQDLLFEMRLHWGATPARAEYVIRNPEGETLEELHVQHNPGAPPQTEYLAGDPPVAQPFELSQDIQQTDLSWLDLTFAFLWWTNATYVGTDTVRGRTAWVLDVPAPPAADPSSYGRARLWIDEQARILLQAEGYSQANELVRCLWIKSFKKIEDRWMIKDLEVQRYPVRHRTKVRVAHVEDVAEPMSDEYDSD